MINKIGFTSRNSHLECNDNTYSAQESTHETPVARKSLVTVFFPSKGVSYTYYNDSFNLKENDIVFVEGKLENVVGRVEKIEYDFKIKLSYYKKIIAVADTSINGKFYNTPRYMVTFDAETIPYNKVLSWYKAPSQEEDIVIVSNGKKIFSLDEYNQQTIERGIDYCQSNRILYIELNQGKGKAIVEGSEIYEVEFDYDNDEFSNFMCSCYCFSHCKHHIAVYFQVKFLLDYIYETYPNIENKEYMAMLCKHEFFLNMNVNNAPSTITIE